MSGWSEMREGSCLQLQCCNLIVNRIHILVRFVCSICQCECLSLFHTVCLSASLPLSICLSPILLVKDKRQSSYLKTRRSKTVTCIIQLFKIQIHRIVKNVDPLGLYYRYYKLYYGTETEIKLNFVLILLL